MPLELKVQALATIALVSSRLLELPLRCLGLYFDSDSYPVEHQPIGHPHESSVLAKYVRRIHHPMLVQRRDRWLRMELGQWRKPVVNLNVVEGQEEDGRL